MSDTVDNVMDAVSEAEPSEDVVVSESEATEETPVEEAPVEEVAEPEPEPEPAVEEPEPVASASETEAAEPEPEPVAEPVAESLPVSTQEVVQNVQEILSSTETNVSGNDLENRVKVLEERLEKLIGVLKESYICHFGEMTQIMVENRNTLRDNISKV